MAYKRESIEKLMVKARGLKREFIKIKADLHVCISKGNRKIGKVMNVSLMPIMTCHNCKECKKPVTTSKLVCSIPIRFCRQG